MAINFGNYSVLLIILRKFEEAKGNIIKSFELNHKNILREDLELELWFYCYAIFYNEYPEAEEKMKTLLDKGVNSPYWDLSGVLDAAKEKSHTDYDKLKKYAELISGENK